MNRRQMLGTSVACAAGLGLPVIKATSTEHLDIPELILNEKGKIANLEELKKHPLLRRNDDSDLWIPVLFPSLVFGNDNGDFFNGSGVLSIEESGCCGFKNWKLSNFIQVVSEIYDEVDTKNTPEFFDIVSVVCFNSDDNVMDLICFENKEYNRNNFEVAKKLITKRSYTKLDNAWSEHYGEEYLIKDQSEFKGFDFDVRQIAKDLQQNIDEETEKRTSILSKKIKQTKECLKQMEERTGSIEKNIRKEFLSKFKV